MPTEIPINPPTPLADLDALLRVELAQVQATFGQHGGRAALARFLGVRPSEVSRYFTSRPGYGRAPSAKILAGMREFVRLHATALPPAPARASRKKAASVTD